MKQFRFYDPNDQNFMKLYEEVGPDGALIPGIPDFGFPPFPPGMLDSQNGCRHLRVHVEFDEEEMLRLNMSSADVQRRWPRFWGNCPDCGEMLIKYASAIHFIAGDW